jgi:hypothetical protein
MSGSPRWSPTGDWIAFDSRESGKSAIYTVDPDSPRPRKVPVSVDDASVPTWSRDGQFLYFTCTKGQQPGIYRTSSAGTGEDKLVSSTVGANVQEAQDGTLYFASAMVDGEIRTLGAMGEERPVRNMPRVLYPNDWVLASKGIYFIDRKQLKASIRFFAFATGKVQTVLNLNKEPAIWGGIALAPDERELIYAQVDDKISDIMLLENFK